MRRKRKFRTSSWSIEEFTQDGDPGSAERAAARRRDFPLPIRTKSRDTEEARK
jgi:hypothetical protein